MADHSKGNVVLLEGDFAIYPKTTAKYHVKVTNCDIFYVPCVNGHERPSSKKPSAHMMKFSDVIGVDCMRGKTSDCPESYLNVYAYPHRKKFASRTSLRSRLCVTFIFSHFSSFEENYKDALQWQLVMRYLIRGISIKPEGSKTAKLPPLFACCSFMVEEW